jgi:pimeloyl-ACP methyl ester carboxylesterase
MALARHAVLRSMLAVAESVERALAGRRPPPRLLTLDLSGTGRVAIGLGDLDRARHVAVLVPGMGADAAHGTVGTVGRADHLLTEAGRQSAESTAVVAWIGYAAPGWQQVPFATRARMGGRLLAADLAALEAARTADGGDPAHVTLVGHSYGSTVIGAALLSGPRRADDLVLLGSPGVLADDVGELGLSGRRVYVGEAPFDPVADLGAFGADPGDAGFGATPVRADPAPGLSWPARLAEAHSHYFDPGSESLRNVARVVVGHGAAVTHPGQAA